MESLKPIAFITGSSRGLGAAIAHKLSLAGWQVALHCRRESLKKTQEMAESFPTKSLVFEADLSCLDQIPSLVQRVVGELGVPSAFISNAGIVYDQLLPLAQESRWDELLNVNLKAPMLLSKLIVRQMIKKKLHGNLLFMTSVIGHGGQEGQSAYGASKGGLTSWSQSLAKELARFSIRSNCLAPGMIDSDMTRALSQEQKEKIIQKIPLGRMGRPEEVAEAVSFLVSPQASYITGTTLHVNGGLWTSGM